MAQETKLKELNLSVNTLQEILDACNKVFQKELGTENWYSQGTTTWAIPELGLNYKSTNSGELHKYLTDITGYTDIRKAYDQINNELESKTSEKNTVYESVPQEGTREVQERERVIREEATAESKRKAIELTEAFIKQRQKISVVPKGKLQFTKLSQEDKKKLCMIGWAARQNPKTTKEIIEKRIANAIEKGGNEELRKIPPKIISNVATDFTVKVQQYGEFKSPDEIPSEIPAALNYESVLYPLTDPNDPNLIKAVPEKDVRTEIAKDAQVMALSAEATRYTNSSLIGPIIGSESITELFYGTPEITPYEISPEEEKRDDGINVDLNDLYSKARDMENLWKKYVAHPENISDIVDSTTSYYPKYTSLASPEVAAQISSGVTGSLVDGAAIARFSFGSLQGAWAAQSIALLPEAPIAGYLAAQGAGIGLGLSAVTSNAMFINPIFDFSVGNFSVGAFAGSSPTVGVFGIEASFGGNAVRVLALQSAGKVTIGVGTAALGETAGVAATTATTTAITTAGGAAGAAAGGLIGQITVPLPVLGAAIGIIAGKILEKIPWEKVKKAGPVIVGVIAGLIAWPFLGIGTGILIGGSAFGLAAGLTGGLPAIQTALSGAGQGLVTLVDAVWITFLAGVGTPILAFLIGFPIAAAFIFFVINSGAYMVPPGEQFTSSTNPYISVTKTANPSGQLPSPTSITYTVTIAAKKDTLTGITIKAECKAIKKGGTTDCPPEDIPTGSEIPTSINAGTPFTFTFTTDYSDYGDKYQDSLVTDTITVTAVSVIDGKVTESGTASVCFGKCPLDCYAFPEEFWKGGSDVQNLKNLLMGAIATLSGKYPDFSAKVCSAGTVNLCYKPGDIQSGIFARHVHTGSCDIIFNTKVASYGNEGTLSLFTHEVTHHIQNIPSGGGYVTKFMDKVFPVEPSICYYGGNDPYESMAEGNALFVARPIIYEGNSCLKNYQSQYPRHYDFAKNVMFAP